MRTVIYARYSTDPQREASIEDQVRICRQLVDREGDVVVAEALDRLSRDQEDVAALLKQLRFRGVRIVTLAEGEISEFHVGLKGTMNALFLKDLAAKTHRGLEGQVREGRSGGGLCYGYDVVREHDARGEPIHGGRRINEAPGQPDDFKAADTTVAPAAGILAYLV